MSVRRVDRAALVAGGQRRLCVGLIGCGRWGQHILRDLLSIDCKVIVVDRSAESRERARSAGADATMCDIAALPPIDAAVVAVPTVDHAGAIDALLSRRIPIFVEKPLSARRADAWRLAGLAPERLFVMDKWRYHPGVEALAAIARSGELGNVLGLRTVRIGWGSPHRDVDCVWTLAPHDLAIALEILGTVPEPRSAIAEVISGAATHMVATLHFGAAGWMSLEVSSRCRAWRREIHLHCVEGVATLDDSYGEHIKITRGQGLSGTEVPKAELRKIEPEMPLLRELRAFVQHVREEAPAPRSSAVEGARIVEAISRLRALAGLRE